MVYIVYDASCTIYNFARCDMPSNTRGMTRPVVQMNGKPTDSRRRSRQHTRDPMHKLPVAIFETPEFQRPKIATGNLRRRDSAQRKHNRASATVDGSSSRYRRFWVQDREISDRGPRPVRQNQKRPVRTPSIRDPTPGTGNQESTVIRAVNSNHPACRHQLKHESHCRRQPGRQPSTNPHTKELGDSETP